MDQTVEESFEMIQSSTVKTFPNYVHTKTKKMQSLVKKNLKTEKARMTLPITYYKELHSSHFNIKLITKATSTPYKDHLKPINFATTSLFSSINKVL